MPKLLQKSLQMFENKIVLGYVGKYVLYIPCPSIDKVTLKCQHDRMRFIHFDLF